MSDSVDQQPASIDNGFGLTAMPLFGISIAATFLGLVLIMLIALTFLLLLRKSGCLRRRKQKTPASSYSMSSTKLLLKQNETVPETTSIPNRNTNGHVPVESGGNQVRNGDHQPLMLQDIPSPQDMQYTGLCESPSRNSWTTRNTSFRLDNEEKTKVVEKLRRPNARIIAELDDELELPPVRTDIQMETTKERNLAVKQGKPSSHSANLRLPLEQIPRPASPTKIFSPTRTSEPPVYPNMQNLRPRSQETPRQSLSSPEATFRASNSPGSSLATSGASSPNTVIFKPPQPYGSPVKVEPTKVIDLESEPKPRRMSGNYQLGAGTYRAVPIPEHEEGDGAERSSDELDQSTSSAKTSVSATTKSTAPSISSTITTASPRKPAQTSSIMLTTHTSPSTSAISPRATNAPSSFSAETTPVKTPRSTSATDTPANELLSATTPASATRPAPGPTVIPGTVFASRPTKLKIPPPTLPKPKYAKKPFQLHSNSSLGHYDVPRIHASPVSNISGSVYSSPTSPMSRQAFNQARNSIAASPSFSPDALSNARHSLATSPGQSPAIFPQALRNDKRYSVSNSGYSPAVSPPDLRNGRNSVPTLNANFNQGALQHSRNSLQGQSSPASHQVLGNGRYSVEDISRQRTVVNQTPFVTHNHLDVSGSGLHPAASRQPYSRHSIASSSVLSPSIPPWERSSSRGRALNQQHLPSPIRDDKPRFVQATDDEGETKAPVYRTTSLHDQHPSSPLNSNIPRMRSSISGNTPSSLYNYPLPGQARRVATIRPSSSVKQNSHHSFQEQFQTHNGPMRQHSGSFKVSPLTVENIEDQKSRLSVGRNSNTMPTRPQ